MLTVKHVSTVSLNTTSVQSIPSTAKLDAFKEDALEFTKIQWSACELTRSVFPVAFGADERDLSPKRFKHLYFKFQSTSFGGCIHL